MLARAVVVGVGLSLAMVPLGAQSKPDFSGTWQLIQSRPEGSSALAGTKVAITQDASNLHIDVIDALMGSMAPKELRRVSYRLSDGPQALIRSVTEMPASSTSALQSPTSIRLGESTVRVTWRGPQLVIVTLNNMVMGQLGNQDPVPVRQMVRQALMLDANGQLVADSIIVVDALPGDTPLPPPTPIRSVFRKAS